MSRQPVHATVVARHEPEGWRGALIRGPSGSGKSDLALRLMGAGWALVVDDWAVVWASGGRLYAAPPETIAGRMEIRGLGVARRPFRRFCRVVLDVQCVKGPLERLPEPAWSELHGVLVPRIDLDPSPASAVQVVAAAADRL